MLSHEERNNYYIIQSNCHLIILSWYQLWTDESYHHSVLFFGSFCLLLLFISVLQTKIHHWHPIGRIIRVKILFVVIIIIGYNFNCGCQTVSSLDLQSFACIWIIFVKSSFAEYRFSAVDWQTQNYNCKQSFSIRIDTFQYSQLFWICVGLKQQLDKYCEILMNR